jgi:hypothetical protein
MPRNEPARLSRRDRLAVCARLDQLAAELEQIGRWLDRFGDDADKGALLAEAAERDLLAACWILRPADHQPLPLGWASVTDGQQAF